jgi:hypothetical protein
MSMLISGGLLIFPRVPMLAIVLVAGIFLTRPVWKVNHRLLAPIGLFIGLLIFAIGHPAGLHIPSLATRFGNFLGALALLAIYVKAGDSALVDDLMALLPWMSVQAVLTVPMAVLLPFLFVDLNFNETPYRTVLLIFNYHVLNEEATTLPRPDGWFFEPGVFQMYLNLYLILALFVKRDVRHAALAAMAVLATQSTTGIVVLFISVASYYWRIAKVGPLLRRARVFLVGFFIALVVGVVAFQNIASKLVGADRGSAWAREYDTFTGLAVAFANPMFGVGLSHESYYRAADELGFAGTALSKEDVLDRGNSNGAVTVLYSLGFPAGMLLFFLLFRQRLLYPGWLVSSAIFFSMLTEALFWSPFVMMFVFSGLVGVLRFTASRDDQGALDPSSLEENGRTH